MDFETLFGLFYTKYRGEENPPSTTDPEWQIAVRNYNNALDRLEEYDDTRWDFLKTTLATEGETITIATGDTNWETPDNMLFPGGLYWKTGLTGGRGAPIKVVKVEHIAMLSPNSQWGYFIGDQHNGYTFHVNPSVPAQEDGWTLDYIYYKKAERLDPDTEDGGSIITGAPAKFFASYMTAQRMLDSRNFPAYQVMLRDAEESLKNLKLRNNSGDYFNNLGVQDAGPGFGS